MKRLHVLRAKLATGGKSKHGAATRWLYRHTFSTGDRLSLYEDLAFLLDNNRTLEVALTNMRDSATDFGKRTSPSAVWLDDCLKAIRNGQSLDVALADWIPPGGRDYQRRRHGWTDIRGASAGDDGGAGLLLPWEPDRWLSGRG
ncbi:hypothetical protein N5C39_24780 [Enterobacter bugandensis]|uniref:Uncharacterized protein n=1 Tax=Enterobacter bugandensis TaxID=881260 RepID=A0AA42PWG2_9ENTR|nr:hypothetical protein [Enterobacter bugandensis]MDH1321566.1 hypothetical protein [Enterobacter bugandensis]